MIVGKRGQGSVHPPLFGDFRFEEDALGGLMSIAGKIGRDEYRRNRHLYVAGSEWVVTRAETGGLDLWGELTRPVDSGGVVTLAARGPGHRLDREIHRVCYQGRSFDEVVNADAAPHNYTVSKKITIDIGRGRAKWIPEKDRVFAGGEQAGILMWEPGERLRRIAFTIGKTDPDAGWELVLQGANTDENGIGAALSADIQTWLLDATNPTGTKIDYSIAKNYDLLRLALRKVGAGTPADPPKFWVTDLRWNGAAADDEFTASEMVGDLFSRIGWDDAGVVGNGLQLLPFRIERQSVREVLEWICLLTGWIAYGRKNVGGGITGYFRPWGDERYTFVEGADRTQLEDPRNLLTLYYEEAGSPVVEHVTVRADPDPLDDDEPMDAVELPFKVPDRDRARDIAQTIVDEAALETYGGTLSAAVLQDENGNLVPAHSCRAGSVIYHPGHGADLKVGRVSGTEVLPTFELVSGVPFADRLVARGELRRARRRSAPRRLRRRR